jgi:hypothetical protein
MDKAAILATWATFPIVRRDSGVALPCRIAPVSR